MWIKVPDPGDPKRLDLDPQDRLISCLKQENFQSTSIIAIFYTKPTCNFEADLHKSGKFKFLKIRGMSHVRGFKMAAVNNQDGRWDMNRRRVERRLQWMKKDFREQRGYIYK